MATVAHCRQPAFTFSPSQLDLLKLIGFIAMLADHTNKTILHYSSPWMTSFGRFAFPLFAVVFAYNTVFHLSQPRRFLLQTVGYGLLAQAPFLALFNMHSGFITTWNALFAFALAWCTDRLLLDAAKEKGLERVPAQSMALLSFLLSGWLLSAASYGWIGQSLILSLIGFFRHGHKRYLLIAALSLLLALGNMTSMGLPILATVLTLSSLGRLAWAQERLLPGSALYVGYAVHLWLLAIICTISQ